MWKSIDIIQRYTILLRKLLIYGGFESFTLFFAGSQVGMKMSELHIWKVIPDPHKFLKQSDKKGFELFYQRNFPMAIPYIFLCLRKIRVSGSRVIEETIPDNFVFLYRFLAIIIFPFRFSNPEIYNENCSFLSDCFKYTCSRHMAMS